MKLTTRSEYALLAMIHLSRCDRGEAVPLNQVARAQKVPLKYLEQLVSALCRAGYLTSTKGQKGGYVLAKPAEKITVAEIIRLFDGALAPDQSVSKYFYKSTPIEKEKKMLALLRQIRDFISDKMEKTTLADLR